MNRSTFLVVSALTSSLVLAGCNKAGKLSQPSTEKTPPTGPEQLVQKWTDGERIVKHIDMKMNLEINVPNQPEPVKQDIILGEKYGLTVSKADSGSKVELEFLSLRMDSIQAGRTNFTYDSAAKGDAPKNRQAAAIAKGLGNVIGVKLDFFLNATNGIDRIEGVDTLMNRLAAGGPAMNNSGIQNMFNKGNLQQMIGASEYLPPQPVQPGDQWPVQVQTDLGEMGSLTVSDNVTFVQWERHGPRLCARLEFDGTFKGKPSEHPNPSGMSMTIQDGTTSGVSWFDPELGTVIDSDAIQDLTMSLAIPIPMGGQTTRQTMKMLMHQVLNVKLDSVK
ncbi:MAG TPA: DUF6263 family protein [Verrucomicrobiae bacterium]|nr:DUF6263 family protein [Verrucomicrobiae bacterium]